LENISETGYQVLITTHSPVIVSHCRIANLIHITSDANKYQVHINITDLSSIIEDLGVSPGNQFIREFEKGRVLVLVEGPDDVKAFTYTVRKYKENKVFNEDFNDLKIVLIPIGGCESVRHWLALNILNDLGKPFYIIQDSDRSGETEISPRQQQLDDLGLTSGADYWLLKKRAIENYIRKSALERVIPGIDIEYDDYTKMKDLCKRHENREELGKDKIVATHFERQTFDELRASFKYDLESDEIVDMYYNIKQKLS
jgi:hypothetical protein